MTEKLSDYFYTKFFECILYDDEIYDNTLHGKYNFYVFDINFLAVFINILEHFINLNILEEKRKYKIYSLMSYIRNNAIFDSIETKRYYCNIFNEFIIKLNTKKIDGSEEFYLNEIAKRFSYNDKKLRRQTYEKKKAFVEKSLGYDFLFLIYHLDEVDEETFESSVDSLLNDEYYFASLNAIIYEFPEILENETFKRRIKKIINLNKRNLPLLLEKKLPVKIYILKNNFKYSSLWI